MLFVRNGMRSISEVSKQLVTSNAWRNCERIVGYPEISLSVQFHEPHTQCGLPTIKRWRG